MQTCDSRPTSAGSTSTGPSLARSTSRSATARSIASASTRAVARTTQSWSVAIDGRCAARGEAKKRPRGSGPQGAIRWHVVTRDDTRDPEKTRVFARPEGVQVALLAFVRTRAWRGPSAESCGIDAESHHESLPCAATGYRRLPTASSKAEREASGGRSPSDRTRRGARTESRILRPNPGRRSSSGCRRARPRQPRAPCG